MCKKSSFLLTLAFVAAASIVLQDCASKKNASSGKNSFEILYFGRSGGFTNQMEKYAIRSNGDLMKEVEGEMVLQGKIGTGKVKEIDEGIRKLNLEELELDEKGNMTYFMEVVSDGKSYRVTWTEATDHPGIKQLYKTLVTNL